MGLAARGTQITQPAGLSQTLRDLCDTVHAKWRKARQLSGYDGNNCGNREIERGPEMGFRGFAYLDVDHPVVAWSVYRGVLVSAGAVGTGSPGAVSMMFAGMMRHQNRARFQNELMIESIRKNRFSSQVSRLEGIYCFDNLALARAAERWGGHFRHENLAELEVDPTAEPTRVDSDWITYAKLASDRTFSRNDLSWVDRYWSGEPYSGFPMWEVIFHGRAVVYGTEVRQRAYEVVARAFPSALDILEVARLGAEVGSDLGQSVAWLTQPEPGRYRLEYYLDMRDAQNPVVLSRLAAYRGIRNVRDLEPGKETFGLPDFREFGSKVTIPPGLAPACPTAPPAARRGAGKLSSCLRRRGQTGAHFRG